MTAAPNPSDAAGMSLDPPALAPPALGPPPALAPLALAPGGRPADPAITWDGRTLTYREFEELIAAAAVGEPGTAPRGMGSTGEPVDISGLPLPHALARAFAAARAGTAVLVRDPALPVPRLGRVPPGSWLVASTSGSTGAPRAVCRTAASWSASVAPLARLAGLTAADRVLVTGPLHATLHLHAAIHTLAIGAELTNRPERATAAHAVPAVLETLLRQLPAQAPLRTVVVAGAPLPDELGRRATARGVAVTEYYGAAELSFVAARRLPDPLLRPFPGVQVRLDADGTLWARSPYLALGYAGDEPAGAGSARPLRRDGDGYATVGDLAAAPTGDPADGLLIRGRGEAAITTGGFTVLVEDVEAVLAGLPGVRAAVVVGTPHPRLGQIVTAVLELDPDTNLAAVRAAARRMLTGPARPRRYLVVDALLRTGGGKIARAAVRDGLPPGGRVVQRAP